KFLVVLKSLQRRVVAHGHDPRQRQPEYCICKGRCMTHIEINWIESMPHMQLRVVIQPAAAKPFVSFADPPTDHIANGVVIEMQIECNGVVETHVLRIQRVSLHHAKAEGHQRVSAPPRKEPYF